MKVLLVLSAAIVVVWAKTIPQEFLPVDSIRDGDAILTKQQYKELYGHDENEPVHVGADADKPLTSNTIIDTRKAEPDEKYRWPKGEIIYVISESSKAETAVIKQAIADWENVTCLKFKEVYDGYTEPHAVFRKLSGCWAEAGYQGKKEGQSISIGPTCEYRHVVTHEVGHAIGLQHEQNRPDRNKVLWLKINNIKPEWVKQYDIMQNVATYGIPYDFNSIMQYPFSDNSLDGGPVVVPKEIKNTLAVPYHKISFFDQKFVNYMYKCDAYCPYKPACQNQGFVDRHCKCVCPDEFEGSFCERYVPAPLACGQNYTIPGTITTPNYPYNYYRTACIWRINAPAYRRVKAYFPDFELKQRNLISEDKGYCDDFLEVIGGNFEGERYCGNELMNQVIFGDEKMDLLFYSKTNYNKGFKMEFTFE